MDVSALLHRRREVAPDSSQLLLYSKGFYSSNSPPRPAFASWLHKRSSEELERIAVELILPSERSRLSIAINR